MDIDAQIDTLPDIQPQVPSHAENTEEDSAPVTANSEGYSAPPQDSYRFEPQSKSVQNPIEANILDDFSEVKILMAETNVLKTHIKVNIKVKIIKAMTTKAIVVYTTTHIEAIIRVIIMANLEEEVMVEVLTMDAVTAGLIIEAVTTINTISIMVMMMTTSLINMAHHVHYVVAIIIPPKIDLRENMILTIMEKMNISGHQSQQSGLYS